jgi:hypothetical protein
VVLPACSRAWLKQGHLAAVKQEDATSHSSTFVKSGTYFCVLTAVVPFHMTVCPI